MKYLFVFFFSIAKAYESQVLFVDFKHSKPAVVFNEINKIHIDQKCESQFDQCINLIKKKISLYKTEQKNEKIFLGHPASELCHSIGGNSLIYFDKDNNEYDYCNVAGYFINSWDIYYNLK